MLPRVQIVDICLQVIRFTAKDIFESLIKVHKATTDVEGRNIICMYI